MNVIHTLASLRTEHGGPSRSVTSLAAALLEAGAKSRVITTRGSGEGAAVRISDKLPVTACPRPRSDLRYLLPRSDFERAIGKELGPNDDALVALHDHGLWLPTNHVAARVARRSSRARIVSIRGMLSEWALRQSRVKKRIAWLLYQRRDLASASIIHVTSDAEWADVDRLGLGVPIACIPNGVDLPPDREMESNNEVRTALFLSRVHPKKGLENLISAWRGVRPSGWRLVIAGPGETSYEAVLRRQVQAAQLQHDVEFVGAVDDEEKWALFANADLFVLSTHSENFGLVVAEALAAGVPVITTRGAPWSELETHRCGWWIESGVEPLSQALREATSLSPERRAEMGRRGRSLVEERYAWPRIAERMMAVYDWLLSGGEPPEDVFYDV